MWWGSWTKNINLLISFLLIPYNFLFSLFCFFSNFLNRLKMRMTKRQNIKLNRWLVILFRLALWNFNSIEWVIILKTKSRLLKWICISFYRYFLYWSFYLLMILFVFTKLRCHIIIFCFFIIIGLLNSNSILFINIKNWLRIFTLSEIIIRCFPSNWVSLALVIVDVLT